MFPANVTAADTEKYEVMRLRAMCYYKLGNYEQSKNQEIQIFNELQTNNPALIQVGDYVQLVRCYLELKQFQDADKYLQYLESTYAATLSIDGIQVLRASYYNKLGDYDATANATQYYGSAITILSQILGPTSNPSSPNTIYFTKRPYTSGESGFAKNNLSEEHFLQACYLLAVCYAKIGNHAMADQIAAAMGTVSSELYGRYASIREKTTSELARLRQTIPSAVSPTIPTLPGTIVTPGYVTNPNYVVNNPNYVVNNPSYIGSGTVSGTGGSQIIATPGSVVQPSSGDNALANASLTSADQEYYLKQCVSYAEAEEGRRLKDALEMLNQLLNNRTVSPQNQVIAAALRGKYLWEKANETSEAVTMFGLAKSIADDENLSKDTLYQMDAYTDMMYYLGKDAEDKGDYPTAASNYVESYRTTSSRAENIHDELLYRLGTVLIKSGKDKEEEAVTKYFDKIFSEEPESDFWTHAALRLAIYDYRSNNIESAEETLDQIIDDIPDEAIFDRVLYLRGVIASRKGEWDVAAAAFDAIGSYTGTGENTNTFRRIAKQRLLEVKKQVR
jgi:tetratricopeptide (TPR) repeat protein